MLEQTSILNALGIFFERGIPRLLQNLLLREFQDPHEVLGSNSGQLYTNQAPYPLNCIFVHKWLVFICHKGQPTVSS